MRRRTIKKDSPTSDDYKLWYVKKWDTSVSIEITPYNYLNGSPKPPESFKNCIVRSKILVLTSKSSFSERNNSKYVRVKSFIFLNSTLISKFLLRKFSRTRRNFWQHKRYWSSISPQHQHIGLTVPLKLFLNLWSLRWVKFKQMLFS